MVAAVNSGNSRIVDSMCLWQVRGPALHGKKVEHSIRRPSQEMLDASHDCIGHISIRNLELP